MGDIVIDKSGNIYAIGNYTGTSNFSNMNKGVAGDNDIFIIKYNTVGDVSWFKTIKSRTKFTNSFSVKKRLRHALYFFTGRYLFLLRLV